MFLGRYPSLFARPTSGARPICPARLRHPRRSGCARLGFTAPTIWSLKTFRVARFPPSALEVPVRAGPTAGRIPVPSPLERLMHIVRVRHPDRYLCVCASRSEPSTSVLADESKAAETTRSASAATSPSRSEPRTDPSPPRRPAPSHSATPGRSIPCPHRHPEAS